MAFGAGVEAGRDAVLFTFTMAVSASGGAWRLTGAREIDFGFSARHCATRRKSLATCTSFPSLTRPGMETTPGGGPTRLDEPRDIAGAGLAA
jgi:hypothetical protein